MAGFTPSWYLGKEGREEGQRYVVYDYYDWLLMGLWQFELSGGKGRKDGVNERVGEVKDCNVTPLIDLVLDFVQSPVVTANHIVIL